MRDGTWCDNGTASGIAAITVPGQTHKVEATAETVVRAVGVYEWTGDLAKPAGSRFMPMTVFIDGDLEDAGHYKPQPVPFALLSGNVYELEDAGRLKGTLVLESALHAKIPDGAPGRRSMKDGRPMDRSSRSRLKAKKTTALKPSKTSSCDPGLRRQLKQATPQRQDRRCCGQGLRTSRNRNKVGSVARLKIRHR